MKNSLRRQQDSLAWRALLLLMSMVLMAPWLDHARMAVQAQGETRVRLDPPASEIQVGDTIHVDIVIEDVADLYGLDVRLSFDPALLEVQDADPATAGVQIENGTFPAPDFVVKNEADNDVGTIWYAVSQMAPTEAVSGSGVAASVTFKGLAEGTSSVAFTYQKIVERDGDEIPATAQNGQITVVLAKAIPTSTPTPKPKPTDTPAPTPTPVPSTEPLPTEPRPTESRPPEAPTTIPPTATPPPKPTSTPTTVSQAPKTPPPATTSRPPTTAASTETPTTIPPTATPTSRPTSAPTTVLEATETPLPTPTGTVPSPTAQPDATEEQVPSSTPFPTVSSSSTSGMLANSFPYVAIVFLGAIAVVAISAVMRLRNR